MGSCCPNFFAKSFRLYHPEPQNSPVFRDFSGENDGFFYIPAKYAQLKAKLTEILALDSAQWADCKDFLDESKAYLSQSLTSLDNFLCQEDSALENSLPKDGKIAETLGNPQEIELVHAKTGVFQGFGGKFHVKKFVFEIKSLVFLGRNDPNVLNLHAPRVEVRFLDVFLKEIALFNGETRRFSTSPNAKSLNPVWNEAFEADLQVFLEILPIHQINFEISVVYEEKVRKTPGKRVLLGESEIFSFRELQNQMIHEKALNIRSSRPISQGFIAVLYFRCQLIHDFFGFLSVCREKMQVKLEIVNKILQKIVFDEKSRKFQGIAMKNYTQEDLSSNEIRGKVEEKRKNPKNLQNFSLMSGENSEINASSLYDNQFYLK